MIFKNAEHIVINVLIFSFLPFLQELKHKATWDLVNILHNQESLMAHCQILRLLFHREGPNYHVEGVPVNKKMEALITKAGIHKEWYVVRLCSALLGKMVDSLAPSITSILVRGKHVSMLTDLATRKPKFELHINIKIAYAGCPVLLFFLFVPIFSKLPMKSYILSKSPIFIPPAYEVYRGYIVFAFSV